MGTLEKILEEIEQKKKNCLDVIKIEVDPMEITIHREQYKGMRKAENVVRKYLNDGWIPVEERLPEDNHFILLSFVNFDLPMIGRYETGQEGGAFYLGDCDEEDTCISQDLFVNAWRPLPKPYRPEESRE